MAAVGEVTGLSIKVIYSKFTFKTERMLEYVKIENNVNCALNCKIISLTYSIKGEILHFFVSIG